jgi:hypothetical protein
LSQLAIPVSERPSGLNGHQAVGHLANDVSGCESLEFFVFDSLEEMLASRALLRVAGNGID